MLYHSMLVRLKIVSWLQWNHLYTTWLHAVMVGSTVYVNYSGGYQLAVRYTSVTIALVMFIGILVLQLADVTGITQCLKKNYNNTRDTQWQTDIQVELKQKWSPSLILTSFLTGWLTEMSMNNCHPLHRITGVTSKHLIALCDCVCMNYHYTDIIRREWATNLKQSISMTSFLISALTYIQQFIMPSSFQCWPAQSLPRRLTENHSTCTL